MLPRRLLSFGVYRGEVAPDFLGLHDHAWIRQLMSEFDRFAGRPERLLTERLQRPLGRLAPRGKLRMATHVLKGLCEAPEAPARPSPADLRQALCRAATALRREGSKDDPVRRAESRVCRWLAIEPEALARAMLGDLPGARPLTALPKSVGPAEVARITNHALASGLLARATHVELTVADEVRRVVRYARLRGLICCVSPRGGDGTRLDISGPMSLFRRTRLYGRALSSLLGQLAASRRWRLRASLDLGAGREPLTLKLGDRDRLLGDAGPDPFDSDVERRFAADFRRVWPAWELRREPPPLQVGATLLFPDFELIRRTGPRRRLLLEIVGFWTPEYLARKLAGLAAAGRDDLILCIDDALGCADPSAVVCGPVVRYRRKVDVRMLQPFLEQARDGGSPGGDR